MKSKFYFISSYALIVLKLLNVIDWSWWIVLAPIYFPLIWVIILYISLTIYQHNLKSRKRIKK